MDVQDIVRITQPAVAVRAGRLVRQKSFSCYLIVARRSKRLDNVPIALRLGKGKKKREKYIN